MEFSGLEKKHAGGGWENQVGVALLVIVMQAAIPVYL